MAVPDRRAMVAPMAEVLHAAFGRLAGPGMPEPAEIADAVLIAAIAHFAEVMGEVATVQALNLRADLIERPLIHAQARGRAA